VNQLKQFPNGDHDDGPDSLEMSVRLLQEIELGKALRRPQQRITV